MGAEKKTDVLLLTINFPEMVSDGTQRGSYLFKVARTLSEETGTRIQVLCFRFRNQEPFEELDGLSVRRIEIPYKSKNDMSPESPKWEDLIPPETHRCALSEFAERACQLADTIGHTVPVWCHEMITYSAAAELRKRGYPVVCVLHALCAQDLMQRLEMADDPVRSKFPRTIASITGALLTSKLRPSFVRVLTQSAPLISKLPLPDSLELLYKLAMESMWMNTAHVLVAVSPSFADSVALYHPDVKSKLRSCMAGAPEPSSQSSWPLPMRGERLKLVMVGRVSLHKGWDYAAEALKNIESKNPAGAERLEFVTIGGLGDYGGGEYGKRVYKSLRELKKITYVSLGHLPHEDVMEIMSGADALLLPSALESFGLVIVEAMANGCMVLASDADGLRDLVKAPWGMLMNFRDPEKRASEIERGILQLLSLSREEIHSRGEEARKAARAYSWKKCAGAHAAALEEARRLCS